MPIARLRRHLHPALLLLTLLPVLPGCASIFSSGSEQVHIPIPEGKHLSFVDSQSISRDVSVSQRGSSLVVEVPSSRPLMFVRRVGDQRDTAIIEVSLKYDYVLMNLAWLPWAPLIDVANDVQFELREDRVTFEREVPSGDSITITIDWPGSDLPGREYGYGKHGILLGAHLGVRSPFDEALVLGNDYGFHLGYRLDDPLALLLGWSSSHVGYRGERIRISPRLSTITLDARFYPFFLDGWSRAEGFYLFGGTAWNDVEDGEVVRTNGGGRIAGTDIDDAVASLETGVGYTMPGAFIEARWIYGLSPFSIRDDGDPVIDVEMKSILVRWGLFLEI